MNETNGLNEGQPKAVATPPKNIVLCFDGTGDWAAKDRTNVLKIYRALVQDHRQIAYYDGGVGTLSDPSKLTPTGRIVMRMLDLALATGLREKVLGGYNFIVRHYNPGDRIYIFGFSRGAFTARVLAGMIEQFGLLMCDCEHLAPYLWQAIADFKLRSDLSKVVRDIREPFCIPDVPVEFLGLFDTVSSVGVLQRFKTYPSADRNGAVKHVRHAISIDEARNCFPESLMEAAPRKEGEPPQDLVQAWFPGVHREVGGGLEPEDSAIANVPLEWIGREAADGGAGLLFKPGAILADTEKEAGPKLQSPGFDWYVFAGIYPMYMQDQRLPQEDLDNPYDRHRHFWPNFTHERRIPEGALIHDVVKAGNIGDKKYSPSNIPQNPSYWDLQGKAPVPSGTTTSRLETRWLVGDFVGLAGGCGFIAQVCDSFLNSWFGTKQILPEPSMNLHSALTDFETTILTWFGHFTGTAIDPHMEHHHIWLLWLLGTVFIISQGYPRRRTGPDGLVPFIAALLLFVLYFATWSLSAFWAGCAAGVLVWVFSRIIPIGPGLHADRALPLVGLWWARVAVLGGVALFLEEWQPLFLLNSAIYVYGTSMLGLGWGLVRYFQASHRAKQKVKSLRVEDEYGRVLMRIEDSFNRGLYRKYLNQKRSNSKLIQASIIVAVLMLTLIYPLDTDSTLKLAWVSLATITVIPLIHIVIDRRRMAKVNSESAPAAKVAA